MQGVVPELAMGLLKAKKLKLCMRILVLAVLQTSAGAGLFARPTALFPRGGYADVPTTIPTSNNVKNQTAYYQDDTRKDGTESAAGSVENPSSNLSLQAGPLENLVAERWRRSLPERLRQKGPKTLQKLRLGQTDVFILGTAHVSNESASDAETLLDFVQPECVFVELCDARVPLLEGEEEDEDPLSSPSVANNATDTKKPSFFEKVKLTQATQGGTRLQAMSTVMLTDIQEDYAKELGVQLGGEFRKAHQYWMKEQKSHLILGDRPLQLTLYRAWESLTWWPKLKLFVALLISSLRKPNKEEIRKWIESIMVEETDVLTKSFDELKRGFPSLYKSIIDERDCWLAAKLFQTCRVLQGRRMTVVAIVGAGHVPGICQWLTNPPANTTMSPEEILTELATTKRWSQDPFVQDELLPDWINEVCELQRVVPTQGQPPNFAKD